MTDEVRDEQTFAIIGAAMEVHGILGRGFLEPVYQAALEAEFQLRGIAYRRESKVPVIYKDRVLDTSYKVDFICFDDIIVELKALTDLTDIERSQVLNYLKASRIRRALLINFGKGRLQFERMVADWHQ